MDDSKPVKNIIIATPNAAFAEGLKKQFERESFKVVELVVVFDHLIEQLEMFQQEGTRVDGLVLTSDLAKKLDDRRLELLTNALTTIRTRYTHLQIVVLGTESVGHPFLAEIVSLGIYNIFLQGTGFKAADLISSFENPKQFPDVDMFRNADPSIPWRKFANGGTQITVNVNKHGSSKHKPQEVIKTEQVIVERVVEKVVEKEVLKETVVEIKIPQLYVIPPKIISVVSLHPQAGATFILDNISTYLAEKTVPVGIVESTSATPIWYEMLDGDSSLPEGWIPWLQQIKADGYVKKGTEWKKGNVFYIPIGKEPILDTTSEDAYKLLYLTKQIPILFVDVSSHLSEMSDVALQQSDEIWIVSTGDPIQMNLRFEQLMSRLKALSIQTKPLVIGNKWHPILNDYLSEDVIKERTGLQLLTTLADVSHINVPAMWDNKKVIDLPEGRALLENAFITLSNRILPEEVSKTFHRKQTSGNKFRLFGK